MITWRKRSPVARNVIWRNYFILSITKNCDFNLKLKQRNVSLAAGGYLRDVMDLSLIT